jgi:hypothetical protein
MERLVQPDYGDVACRDASHAWIGGSVWHYAGHQSEHGIEPMTDQAPYDSRAATLAHIQLVRDHLDTFVTEMLRRGARHDASKLTPAEKPTFDLLFPLLKGVSYGSPEYQELVERAKPALQHHYAHNSHHPEYHGERGIAGMDLFDIVEMICDWMASARRHPADGVKLGYNIELFGIEPQLASILANTLERWPEP